MRDMRDGVPGRDGGVLVRGGGGRCVRVVGGGVLVNGRRRNMMMVVVAIRVPVRVRLVLLDSTGGVGTAVQCVWLRMAIFESVHALRVVIRRRRPAVPPILRLRRGGHTKSVARNREILARRRQRSEDTIRRRCRAA